MEIIESLRGKLSKQERIGKGTYDQISSFRMEFQMATEASDEISNKVTELVIDYNDSGNQIFLPTTYQIVAIYNDRCEKNISTFQHLCERANTINKDPHFIANTQRLSRQESIGLHINWL